MQLLAARPCHSPSFPSRTCLRSCPNFGSCRASPAHPQDAFTCRLDSDDVTWSGDRVTIAAFRCRIGSHDAQSGGHRVDLAAFLDSDDVRRAGTRVKQGVFRSRADPSDVKRGGVRAVFRSRVDSDDVRRGGDRGDFRSDDARTGGDSIPASAADSVPQILRRAAFSASDMNLQRLIDSSSGANIFSTVCNIADSLIGTFLGPESLKPHNDPAVQLSGNYAPVRESPPQKCVHIDGALPPDLNGIYIRNGPNATRLFEREGYHMFDGDGMLHGVRMQAGSASYCSRYVRTSRFVQEEIAGRPLFLKFFGGFYGSIGFARAGLVLVRAVLGVLSMSEGWGLSNTSVCYFNGRVLSLSEDDMPYVIRVTNEGDFITLGRLQFSHTAPSRNMCAHPKFDPATGEMFAFSFRPSLKYPYSFYKVSPNGLKSKEVTIPLKEISFIHDFAITQNYAIFPDNQFVIRPWKFLRGEMPVVCDKTKTPRFCVVRRDATTQSGTPRSLWFEAPECNGYHYINAWEEGDEVVLITSIISPPERFLDIPARGIMCNLHKVRLNLANGVTSMKRLCNENLEFGTFNLKYTGRKMRYVYLAVGCYPEISGIVKVDLEAQLEDGTSCIVARRNFGENCHGNEPFFVPSSIEDSKLGNNNDIFGSPSSTHEFEKDDISHAHRNGSVEEDEGYVLCLVHNHSTSASHLLVMDAQSPSLDILASIKLPSRVPYGFHGFFIHENELAKQTSSFSQ